MEQEHSTKDLFLQAFITELIKNAKLRPRNRIKKQAIERHEEEILEDEMPKGMTPSSFQIKQEESEQLLGQSGKHIIPKEKIRRRLPIVRFKKRLPLSLKIQRRQKMFASHTPKKTQAFPIQKKEKPEISSEKPEFGELNNLIKDPRVEGIECPGPNKNILVKKDGAIQKTKISLNQEKIKKIINDFSQKTRIPLISGTFKAALGNIIMTAVNSDFVGSRFVIQKKNPFAR